MSRTVLIAVFVLAACSKKDSKPAPTAGSSEPPAAASGSSAGSGSAQPSAGSATGSADGSAAAAGSGSAAGSGAAGSGAGSDGPAFGDDTVFADLKKEDKGRFMRTKVVPAMKTAFQGVDGKKFAKFNCKTCHGKGADTKEFKMPNPGLPKLDFAALKAGKGGDKKVIEFMGKIVKPEMAKILHKPEMSETVKDGFGCLACHEMKKK